MSDEELKQKIRDITKVMLIALSEWQAGVPVDYYSAKVKGRQELFDLIKSRDQQIANAARLEEHNWSKEKSYPFPINLSKDPREVAKEWRVINIKEWDDHLATLKSKQEKENS